MTGTILTLLLAALCYPVAAATTTRQLQEACEAESGPSTSLADVEVGKTEASPGDLAFYEAHSRTTGNRVRIYHDPDLADAAASKAGCFMGMLDLLSTVLPHLRGTVRWSPIVLTRNPNYIPPQRDGELRWKVPFASGSWEPASLRFLFVVMPHEEVHLSQATGGPRMPRWFEEGHAEWAGLQVTGQVVPGMAAEARRAGAEALRRMGAAHLAAWGGIKVKPEAIERQLSAEDRERRRKDPAFIPPGPFNFGPGDFAEDNSNEPGRYGAALALFDGLEERHGRAAVQAWVQRVLESKDASQIVPLAKTMLGEDLAPLLL